MIQQSLWEDFAHRDVESAASRHLAQCAESATDRVLMVEADRVVEDGTPADLRVAGGHYADLHTAWRESLV